MPFLFTAVLAGVSPDTTSEACEVARSAFVVSLRQRPDAYPLDIDDAPIRTQPNVSHRRAIALGLSKAESSSLKQSKDVQDAWSASSCKWSGVAFRKPDGLNEVQFAFSAPLFAPDHKLAIVAVDQSTPLWRGQGDICAVRRRARVVGRLRAELDQLEPEPRFTLS